MCNEKMVNRTKIPKYLDKFKLYIDASMKFKKSSDKVV